MRIILLLEMIMALQKLPHMVMMALQIPCSLSLICSPADLSTTTTTTTTTFCNLSSTVASSFCSLSSLASSFCSLSSSASSFEGCPFWAQKSWQKTTKTHLFFVFVWCVFPPFTVQLKEMAANLNMIKNWWAPCSQS